MGVSKRLLRSGAATRNSRRWPPCVTQRKDLRYKREKVEKVKKKLLKETKRGCLCLWTFKWNDAAWHCVKARQLRRVVFSWAGYEYEYDRFFTSSYYQLPLWILSCRCVCLCVCMSVGPFFGFELKTISLCFAFLLLQRRYLPTFLLFYFTLLLFFC